MPVDFYPQKSVQELLLILNKLQNRQVGGAVTEVTAAGVRTAKEIGSGNSRVEVEIQRVFYSLFVRDPDQYANPYASRIRRTRTRYTFS